MLGLEITSKLIFYVAVFLILQFLIRGDRFCSSYIIYFSSLLLIHLSFSAYLNCTVNFHFLRTKSTKIRGISLFQKSTSAFNLVQLVQTNRNLYNAQ